MRSGLAPPATDLRELAERNSSVVWLSSLLAILLTQALSHLYMPLHTRFATSMLAILLASPVVLGFAIALAWRRRFRPGRFVLAGIGMSIAVALVEMVCIAGYIYLKLIEVGGTEAA